MYSLVRLVPSQRNNRRPVVAAFDVDGTLTTRDCVTPFLRHVAGPGSCARSPGIPSRSLGPSCVETTTVSRSSPPQRCAASTQRSWRGAARLRGRDPPPAGCAPTPSPACAAIESWVTSWCSRPPRSRRISPRSAAARRRRRRLHAARGRADGRLTGRLLGANCRGPEKARRVREWLDQAGLGRCRAVGVRRLARGRRAARARRPPRVGDAARCRRPIRRRRLDFLVVRRRNLGVRHARELKDRLAQVSDLQTARGRARVGSPGVMPPAAPRPGPTTSRRSRRSQHELFSERRDRTAARRAAPARGVAAAR